MLSVLSPFNGNAENCSKLTFHVVNINVYSMDFLEQDFQLIRSFLGIFVTGPSFQELFETGLSKDPVLIELNIE